MAGGFAPRPPSVIRLSYTRLLTMSPTLDILTFQHLLQTLPLQQNPSCGAKPGHGFWSSILRYRCPVKSASFQKCFKMSLHAIWAPPIKNLGSPVMTPSIKTPLGWHHCNIEWLCWYALTLRVSVCPRSSVPCCNNEDFPHLDFTDRHTVTIMSLWRTQIILVKYIG